MTPLETAKVSSGAKVSRIVCPAPVPTTSSRGVTTTL